ncbi:MAG: P1 family peptidase [Mogibacterium sp.]|nr:P1 family peptidase [Mogibacterium sp.]
MGLPPRSIHLRRRWPSGSRNLISDVPGVTVGHVTHREGSIQTGVTAVLPHPGNLFRDKVMAGCCVINGFGKSIGLLQLQELGSIETPILLTNTMSVGTAYTALCRYMMEADPDIGVTTGTVNCLVTECNDGRLNDIRGMHVTEEDIPAAIRAASADFAEGAVGGGTGMTCLGLKGGIGSASRVLSADGSSYTIGALVMSNFGAAGNLVMDGRHYDTSAGASSRDKGSIIILIATDLPLSERQLERVARRSAVALGRTGSYLGNGSGDIAIAFTTANRIPHESSGGILTFGRLHEDLLDQVFEATAETVEEAILSSLWHADTVTGVRGTTVTGLRDFLAGLGES